MKKLNLLIFLMLSAFGVHAQSLNVSDYESVIKSTFAHAFDQGLIDAPTQGLMPIVNHGYDLSDVRFRLNGVSFYNVDKGFADSPQVTYPHLNIWKLQTENNQIYFDFYLHRSTDSYVLYHVVLDKLRGTFVVQSLNTEN